MCGKKEVLNEKHASTIDSQFNLVVVMGHFNIDQRKAIVLIGKVAKGYKEVLGSSHAKTVNTTMVYDTL